MGRYKKFMPNRLVLSPDRPVNFLEPDLLLSSQMSPKKALGMEIMIRETAWNYYRVLGFLPNPSETLRKLSKDISEYKYLLEDAFVNGCMSSRKAGTLSLKWSLDQNTAQVRQFKIIDSLFKGWPMTDIMDEILNCCFFGYQPVEINWEKVGGNWLPKEVVPKDPDWIRFSDLNETRYLTKRNMVTGEPVPAYKIIMPRYRPSYERPYGRPLGSVVYWPVKFRHGGLKFWTQFCEKFGSPWVMAKYPLGTQQVRIQQMVDMIDETIQDGIVALPKEFDAEVMATNKGDSSTIYKTFIDNMNEDISIGILGQTLTTKIGQTGGAFAAAKVHADVRGDIVNQDKSIVEMVFNTLISWIYELNWGGDESARPKFQMIAAPAPTKDDGALAVSLKTAGVTFTKEYFENRFGLKDTEFDLAPEQRLGPDGQPMQANATDPGASMLTHQGTDLAQNDSTYDSSMESVHRMTRRFNEANPAKVIMVRHGETKMNADGDKIRGGLFNYGGEGSGNWGHAGRPGEVGGSGEGGSSPAPAGVTKEQVVAHDKEMIDKVRMHATPEEKAELDKIEAEMHHDTLTNEGNNRHEIYARFSRIDMAVERRQKTEATEAKKQKAFEKAKAEVAKYNAPASKGATFYSEKASHMSIDDISKSLDEKGVKNNLAGSVKTGQLDLKQAQALHASIDHTMSDYGKEVFNARVPGGVQIAPLKETWAGLFNNATGEIKINSRMYGADVPKLEEGDKWDEHYSVGGGGDAKYTLDHEIGHAFTIDHGVTEKMGFQGDKALISKEVSTYALSNIREQYAEIFCAGRNDKISNPVIQSYFNKIDAHVRGIK